MYRQSPTRAAGGKWVAAMASPNSGPSTASTTHLIVGWSPDVLTSTVSQTWEICHEQS